MEDYYNEMADDCNDLAICSEFERKIPKKRAVTDILNFERLNLKEGLINYGYYIDKEKILKKLADKEGINDQLLFSKDSFIAKDNKGVVNPAYYLTSAFTRFSETGEDEMHLSDTIVYSNEIYQRAKENPTPSKLFGPIKKFITGVIMDYLDYDFLIRKVRYLNKSFIVFTQENCHYSSQMLRRAYLKVSLKEMFEGKVRMPILNHPYYTNCTKLTIIYQTCNKTENSDLIKEYDTRFMKELFESTRFFPLLKELKIVVSHSQVIEFDKENLSQHYKYLIFSAQLSSLERIIISDTRLMIDWKIFQLMTPDDFPYLKYLELPNNCFYDFTANPETPIQEFPNLHLKYFISVDNNQEFYNGLKSRFYNRFAPQEMKCEETNCLSLIKCDKLQLDVPLHEGIYSNLFASFNHIDNASFLAHDKHEHLKALKKWCFKNAKFSNNAFDASRNMAHILIVRDKATNSKSSIERKVEDFEHYDFFDDYVDPLEEFVAPYNNMTDHCLYILTHSPSFQNLKIIDLRANPISSLKTLIAKGRNFYAPKLEELYIDTTVEDTKESYDISFFFNGYVDRLTKLKVLYIESKENPLIVSLDDEVFQISKLSYIKLYLRNISFLNKSGQKLFDNLQECEELVVDHCKFDELNEHKALMNLTSLKSLSIGDKNGESVVLLDALKYTPYLMNSLKILKLWSIKSNNIFEVISKLKNIFQIVLVNIDFTKQVFNQNKNKLFSMKLNKLDLYRCKISCQSLLSNIFLSQNNITDLCLLDNKYDETGGCGKKRKNSSPLELPKVVRLTIDDLYLSLQGKEEQWEKILSIFPNIEDLLYYKRKLKAKLPTQFVKTNQPITSIVKLINSGMTKIRKFTQIKNLPNDYHSDPGHATPKVRGLFEYRFDPYTTIDHFD